jgi:hypothetical protein
MNGRLVYAKLNQARVAGMGTSVGIEFDAAIVHKPMERLELRFEGGVLAPGDAFQVGGIYKNQTAFGLMTKAAITF